MFKDAWTVIPKVKILLEEARKKRILIVYACDTRSPDDRLFKRLNLKPHAIKGTKGWEVVGEITPSPADLIIEKRMLSAFFGTSLDSILREKNVETLIVVGIATDVCLLKTVLDAFELGYEVIVPADGCAALSRERHKAALKIMAENLKVKTPTMEEVLKTL